jgi:VanZ family protein
MKKILLVLLAFLTVCFVFFLSRMPYTQQSIIPELQTLLADEPFKEQLSKIELTYWNETISVETRGYHYFIEFLIRKFSHFAGYGIVGIIFCLLFIRLKWRFAPFLAIASVFVVACIDETIQYYTPGRTGIFDDVIIDVCGATLFVSIFWLLYILSKKSKKRSKKTRKG